MSLTAFRSRAVAALTILGLAGCRAPATGGSAGIPLWPDTLPAAEVLGSPRGLAPVRAVLHVHSILSHDACDGAPVDEAGRPNVACLARFRRAICTARLGAVFLTEHDRRLVEAESLADALLFRDGDRPIRVDGALRASLIACPGRTEGALLFPGAENQLMPVAFDSLPSGTREDRRAFYDADTVGSAAAFRRYGAVVLMPHPEDEPLATIAGLDPDGIEIYNPHANFAFKHRVHQGLSRFGAVWAILPFYLRTTNAHPDLAILAIFRANHAAIDRWDALLSSGSDVFGFGASDAHENSLRWKLADGDRGDSYERMLPWVTNILLVATRDAAGIEDALRAGRFYVALEAWGTPAGFDFRLEGPDGIAEMGSAVPLAAGQRLVVELPRVAVRAPAQPEPRVRARLYRLEAGGRRRIVAESGERIDVPVAEPGAYRVEVGIVPRHLEPWLGGPDYVREVPWIYSNPIRVTPGGAIGTAEP